MTMTREEKMVLKTPVSREEAERVLAKNGIGCGAVMALRFAHTLLATMTELEQVKGERDHAVEVADRDHARAEAQAAVARGMELAAEILAVRADVLLVDAGADAELVRVLDASVAAIRNMVSKAQSGSLEF